jgi:hypothetical protein
MSPDEAAQINLELQKVREARDAASSVHENKEAMAQAIDAAKTAQAVQVGAGAVTVPQYGENTSGIVLA